MKRTFLRLRFLLSSMLSLCSFILQILSYKFFGKNSSSKKAQKVFYFFGGLPSTIASKLLSSKKLEALEKSSLFESLTSSANNGDSLKSALDKKGFYVIEKFMNKNEISELRDYSLNTQGAYRIQDSGTQSLIEPLKFNRQAPLAIRYDYPASTLLINPVAQKLISNPAVLGIAQKYLNCAPILDFVTMWWHTQSLTPDKQAAQYFHFDMDRLRWVKFFFYLTNVNGNNGPHVFIPGTHTDFGMKHKIRSKGYTRLEDEFVAEFYPRSLWKEFIAPEGTMIVEDTRGLHKGAHVEVGDRLVFQIQFTSSLFGTEEVKDNHILSRKNLGSELSKAILSYPETYQKITLV